MEQLTDHIRKILLESSLSKFFEKKLTDEIINHISTIIKSTTDKKVLMECLNDVLFCPNNCNSTQIHSKKESYEVCRKIIQVYKEYNAAHANKHITFFFQINQILAEWNPLSLGEIAIDEYSGFIPEILHSAVNKKKIEDCLAYSILPQLGCYYDPSDNTQIKELSIVSAKIMETYTKYKSNLDS